jgi:transposase, IS6 family
VTDGLSTNLRQVNGVWRYVYRAVDQHGQVIDVLVSRRRDADAARRFFRRALSTLKVTPSEVVTDAAAVYPGVLDELIPSAWHHVEQCANNPIEADHGRLTRKSMSALQAAAPGGAGLGSAGRRTRRWRVARC